MAETSKATDSERPIPQKRHKSFSTSLEVQAQALHAEVEALRVEAYELSTKLEDQRYKIKRSEFIKFAEETERSLAREKMAETKARVMEIQEKEVITNTTLNNNQQLLEQLTQHKHRLAMDLDALRVAALRQKTLLSDKRQELARLQRQSRAMMASLTYQKTMYGDMIVKYTTMLQFHGTDHA